MSGYTIKLSPAALSLFLAEQALLDAVQKKRRWRLREQEASAQRQAAQKDEARYQKLVDAIRSQLS